MSIDGSIAASALFHDKDGTTTVKVVSLESVESPSDGRVAVITGTCNSSGTSINLDNTGYIAADGTQVGWTGPSQTIRKIAFSSPGVANLTGDGTLLGMKISSAGNDVAMTRIPHGSSGSSGTYSYTLTASAEDFETAAYTIVVYGD